MPHRRYVIETSLKDGTEVCLRTIRPSDEERLRDGIRALSDQSRYLRFFSAFREPPPDIVRKLVAVDGHDHIGWGAIRTDLDEPLAIGAAHAIRSNEDPAKGELAVALLDDYHRLGLARMLIALVLSDCIEEDILTLEMDVIAENSAASGLVRALGADRIGGPDVVERYCLDVAQAIATLRQHRSNKGLIDIFAARENLA
jgi:GNAT superfamily N-acetyltransferase